MEEVYVRSKRAEKDVCSSDLRNPWNPWRKRRRKNHNAQNFSISY